jgi:hypothetical protein
MPEVEMIPVESSSIKKVGYDAEEKEMYIRFVSGFLYVFQAVPEELFDELVNADSVGSYFAVNVKGQYTYYKV